MQEQGASDVARSYYDSSDADRFYSEIWGGENIHIGIYESEQDSIEDASHRTVEAMLERLSPLRAEDSVLDLGSGYCGAARVIASRFGCKVVGVNISEVENARARRLNADAGLAENIQVIDGSFEAMDLEPGRFDAAWSQDAILHSDNPEQVFAEVARVLRVGGRFVMTDPMQSDDAERHALKPILARLHLQSLGSPKLYRDAGEQVGLVLQNFEDLTHQLVRHYEHVQAALEQREHELESTISREYIAHMKEGLSHWIEGGRRGQLAWGIFEFVKG